MYGLETTTSFIMQISHPNIISNRDFGIGTSSNNNSDVSVVYDTCSTFNVELMVETIMDVKTPSISLH